MNVVIGTYHINEDCFKRKAQILGYLEQEKAVLPSLSVLDLSPVFLPNIEDPTKDMRHAVELFIEDPASKTILLCRAGHTAQKVARALGFSEPVLSVQESSTPEEINHSMILAMGYLSPWEDTRKALQIFLKEWR